MSERHGQDRNSLLWKFQGLLRRREAESVRDAENRYAARYKPPRENPQRVVVEITVQRVLGSASLRD